MVNENTNEEYIEISEKELQNIAMSSALYSFFIMLLMWSINDISYFTTFVFFILLTIAFFMFSKHINVIKTLILLPSKSFRDTEGLQEKNLIALLKRRTVSDFLEYRTYMEEEKSGLGFYTMRNGRRGFVLRVYPGAFIGENVESILTICLEAINTEGAVANFFTFASRNVENRVKEFEDIHLHGNINVEHPEVLRDMIKSRARHLRKWTNESMLDGVDLRLRDFINTVSFSFPKETTDVQLRKYYLQIRGSLSELNPTNFSGNDMIIMVKEILSPEIESWDSPKDYSIDMATQMTNEGTRIRTTQNEELAGDIRIGETWYARAITTKNFPEVISLSEFSGLFFDKFGKSIENAAPSPFMVSLTISYDNVEVTNKKLAKKAAWNIKETNKLDSTIRDSYPEIDERAEEARLVTRYQTAGEVPLLAKWNCVIMDNDKERLEEIYSKLVAIFRKKNWSIIKESFGNVALMSMMSMLPLNDNEDTKKYLKRFRILFLSNNTQIAPLISDARGTKMVIPYVARSGQLQGLDFYSSDTNYNVVSAGESGSGKSYTQNDIHAMVLAAGYNVRGIDAGGSYRYLNMFVGGQYIDFAEGNNVCLNFFTKIHLKRKLLLDENGAFILDEHEEPIETDELVQEEDDKGVLRNVIHPDEYKTIVPLIGQMAGVKLAATSSENANIVNDLTTKFIATSVEDAIQTSYWQLGENAGMETVYRSLKDQINELVKSGRTKDVELMYRFLDSIAPYCLKRGMFYSYFNGPNNINFKSAYVIAELDDLKNKGDLYFVVLMSFAQTVMAEFFGDRKTPKIFFVDEAWMVFDKPIVVAFLNDLYRRIRKYNGIAITITQGINDYFLTSMTASMYNNANWKYFLQIGSDGIDKVAKGDNVTITSFLASILKSVRNNKILRIGECVVFSERTLMISRIKTDPLSHYTFSGMSPQEKPLMDSIIEKYHVNIQEAVKIAALRIEHKVELNEAYKLLKGDEAELLDDMAKKEQLDKKLMIIEDAINMDRVVVYKQRIQSINNDYGDQYEHFMRLITEDKTILSPIEFLDDARELNLYGELVKIVIDKIFAFHIETADEFSMNISLSDIRNEEITKHLYSKIQSTTASNRFIIEILFDGQEKIPLEEIQFFIQKVKEYNVRITFDDIGMGNIDFVNLYSLDVDFLKLESSLIRNIESDKNALEFVKLISSFAKVRDLEMIAIHVEKESTIQLAQEIGISFVQGYAIEKPILMSVSEDK